MMQPDASRRPYDQTAQPPPDPVAAVWQCRSKKLSAPDKRAFEFLWRLTEGGRRDVLVTPIDVGWDQGTTSDAGKDRLDNLAGLGFIRCQAWGKKGNYRVACLDPWQALDGLRPVGQKDPQTRFDGFAIENNPQPASEDRPFGVVSGAFGCGLSPGGEGVAGDPPEEAPEDPPEDPRRLFLSSEKQEFQSQPSIFGKPSESSVDTASPKDSENGRRGTSGGTSPDDEFLRTLEMRRRAAQPGRERAIETPIVARVASLPSAEAQRQSAEEKAQWILQRVNCPRMRMSPCIRMAWNVVEGRIPLGRISQLLASLDQADREGRLQVPRSVYANKGFDRLCAEFGVPLPKRQPK